jgi:YVTN family beta-propeller protein
MRKIQINVIIISGLLLIFFLCAHASADIQDMKLLTSKIGWTVTEKVLYWTTNGGAQWKNITPQSVSNGYIASVFFLNPLQGWALCCDTNTKYREFSIAYTNNGGTTWSTKPIALFTTLLGPQIPKNFQVIDPNEDEKRAILNGVGRIDFVDANHGWVLWEFPFFARTGYRISVMLRTEDGGQTWKLINNHPLLPIPGDFHFVTATKGWLAGYDGNLYVTNDGGNSWEEVFLKAPDQVVSIGGTRYNLPIFIDNKYGFLSVIYKDNQAHFANYRDGQTNPETLVLFTTLDGGITWKAGQVVKNVYGMMGPSTIADSVFITATSSKSEHTVTLLKTTPNGKIVRMIADTGTWAANNTKPNNLYNGWWKFSFVTSNQGWMATYDQLLATNDGGTTWNVITPSIELNSPEPENPSHAFISGPGSFENLNFVGMEIRMRMLSQTERLFQLLPWLNPSPGSNVLPIPPRPPKSFEKKIATPSPVQWKTGDMEISLIGLAWAPANSTEMISKGRKETALEKPVFFKDRLYALALHFQAKRLNALDLNANSGLGRIKNIDGEIEAPLELTPNGFVQFSNSSNIRDIHFQQSNTTEYWDFFPTPIDQKNFVFKVFPAPGGPPALSFRVILQDNDFVIVKPEPNKVYTSYYGDNNITMLDGSETAAIDGFNNVITTIDVGLSPSALAINPTTNRIYIVNHGSVNAPARYQGSKIIRAIRTGEEKKSSHAVAIDPVINKIYVANWSSNNVTVIDDLGTSKTVAVGLNPYAIAVNPETHRVYVTNHYSNDVTVIDSSGTTRTIAVGLSPYGVAVNPVTNKIYVANGLGDDVTVIDGSDNSTTTITAGTAPYSVAVNPMTNKIYVANWSGNDVTVINGADNSTTTVRVGSNPITVAVNSVTNKIYTANINSDNVTVINGSNNSTTTIDVGSEPFTIAVNPTTNKIYVANIGSSNITAINGTDNSTTTIEVGDYPCAIAINPTTNKVYVVNHSSQNVALISE